MVKDGLETSVVEHGATPSWMCPDGSCACHADEHVTTHEVAILLHDADGNRLAGAPCRVWSRGRWLCEDARSDASGWVVAEVPTPHLTTLLLQWRSGGGDSIETYHLRYRVILGATPRERTLHRIANLGFSGAPTPEDNVRNFERHYGLRPTGRPESIEALAIEFHDFGRLPVRRVDRTEPGPAGPREPPRPPRATGATPVGDGEIPGRGGARVQLLRRDIRLLDHFHEPCPGTACSVTTSGWTTAHQANDEGIVAAHVPADVEVADVAWSLDGAEISRPIRVTAQEHQETISERLHNLGFVQPSGPEQLVAYRLSMRHAAEIPDAVVQHEIRHWHDGGPPPHSIDASPGQSPHPSTAAVAPLPAPIILTSGSAQRVATACPRPRVHVFFDDESNDYVPYRQARGPNWNRPTVPLDLVQLNIWKGQHSAITIENFPKKKYRLYSGNPLDAVPGPGDGKSWVDFEKDGRRHVFFHGWYETKHRGPACSLFDIAKGCTILQVWTHDIKWGSQRAWLRLYGKVFVLNSLATPNGLPAVRPYGFDNEFKPTDGTPFSALMKAILDQTKNGPLTHLVINAHGTSDRTSAFKIHCGEGFDTTKAAHREAFDQLRGKVKYIWFQACSAGMAPGDFAADIAERTSAWTIVAGLNTPDLGNQRSGCIDWDESAMMTVRHHPTSVSPVKLSEFFHQARHSPSTDKFSTGLDFNLVRVVKSRR